MDPTAATPPVVALYVWRVPTTRVPAALGRMAWDHVPLSRGGSSFHRLLGTSRAGGFGLRDADVNHWAVLTCWPDAREAAGFERSRTVKGWDRLSDERLRLTLRPLSSRGRWGGREPFGRPAARPEPGTPVAALTRARLRGNRSRTFRRAVPAVTADLARAEGLRLAVGIGESPVGLQGTLSLWDGADALTRFAYRGEPHVAVVRRTPTENWYVEELFARFAVLEADGTYDGSRVD